MTRRRKRYRQETLPVPGATPVEYDPPKQRLAPPAQGWLPLDGGALGPLFNQQEADR